MVALQAQTAGAYILRILLFPDASLHKENRQPEVLRESRVAVREAGASSARSFLTSFWPPQGAVAGVPAGFVIQVSHFLLSPMAPFSGARFLKRNFHLDAMACNQVIDCFD